ncbi:unnamed protein product, partial [Rhizoctonia solani]
PRLKDSLFISALKSKVHIYRPQARRNTTIYHDNQKITANNTRVTTVPKSNTLPKTRALPPLALSLALFVAVPEDNVEVCLLPKVLEATGGVVIVGTTLVEAVPTAFLIELTDLQELLLGAECG